MAVCSKSLPRPSLRFSLLRRHVSAILGAVLRAGLRNRRSVRLRDYDYTAAGPYFVTLCAYRGRCLFGQFINGRIVLTPIGQIVRTCWEQIPSHFPSVTIDAYVIMPNHMHGIIMLHEKGTACRAPTPVAENPAPFAPILHEARTREDFASPVSCSLPTILRTVKSAVTRRVHGQARFRNVRVWQRGYYEHVIRNIESLEEIRRYIIENRSRWPEDSEHPVFVRHRMP